MRAGQALSNKCGSLILNSCLVIEKSMQTADLVRYNHAVRELYFGALSKLPWSEVVAKRGLSFDSMRDVFLHLTLVEDRWINYSIPGRFKEWVDPKSDSFQSHQDLKKYMEKTQKSTQKYLATLNPAELDRKIPVPWSEKPGVEVTVERCLIHMVLEDMVHFGELSAAFWQMGQDAPYMGFWRFGLQNQMV
jgi:uncharacterized damage-inducible protein DinB